MCQIGTAEQPCGTARQRRGAGRHDPSANDGPEKDLRCGGDFVPGHVIRVAGLDTGRMAAERRTARAEYAKHGLVRRNCSLAVARVLKAGSAGGNFLGRHGAIRTPLEAERPALSMGGTRMTWIALPGEAAAAGALIAGSRIRAEHRPEHDARHGRGSAT